MKISVLAPGKLLLSGEWSVLEPGNPAIVLAVDRYIACTVEDSESYVFNFPDLGIENLAGNFDKEKSEFTFIAPPEEMKNNLKIPQLATDLALSYVHMQHKEVQVFTLTTDSQDLLFTTLSGEQIKLGLGASAATAVAIIGGILKKHGVDIVARPSRLTIFKLAAIAHYLAQGKVGSGFDIAASTFGKAVLYKRFDPVWLTKQIDDGTNMNEIVAADWPGLEIERIKIPYETRICCGWTGEPSSTSDMIKQMMEFKQRDPATYNDLLAMAKQTTESMLTALEQNNHDHILNLIEANQMVLIELTKASGVPINTPQFDKFCEIAKQYGGRGKVSGAGGGDCGVALCFDEFVRYDIEDAWEEAGITAVDVALANEGISVTF
jgi:phosphomevalonate kinase